MTPILHGELSGKYGGPRGQDWVCRLAEAIVVAVALGCFEVLSLFCVDKKIKGGVAGT